MEEVVRRLKTGIKCGIDVFIASNAVLAGEILLGDDTGIWFGVIIRADVDTVSIGDRSNIQDGSVVHVTKGFPVNIGSDVTVGHGAMLHGCSVGCNSLIGIGSIILDGSVIGKNSIVAAGTLIPPGKIFPDNSFIMGHPGKLIKSTNENDINTVVQNSLNYVEYKNIYMRNFNNSPCK